MPAGPRRRQEETPPPPRGQSWDQQSSKCTDWRWVTTRITNQTPRGHAGKMTTQMRERGEDAGLCGSASHWRGPCTLQDVGPRSPLPRQGLCSDVLPERTVHTGHGVAGTLAQPGEQGERHGNKPRRGRALGRDGMRRATHPCPPTQTHNLGLIVRKTADQSQCGYVLENTGPVLLKTVKVDKNEKAPETVMVHGANRHDDQRSQGILDQRKDSKASPMTDAKARPRAHEAPSVRGWGAACAIVPTTP